ncbi:unnamed protein product, partial [Vitis vinifera]
MNFNSNCILRLCSQKQFHIDPACIREVQEISLSSQFQHKHIVQYYGTFKDWSSCHIFFLAYSQNVLPFQDKTKLYIFLELATGGSLLNLYQKHKLSDSQASKYTRQIVKGLKYLHEHNVVHRLLGEVKSSTLPPALFQEKKNGKTKNKKKSQEHGC